MKDKINIIDLETFGEEVLTPYCMSILYKGNKYTAYGERCVFICLNWIFNNCNNKAVFFAHNLNFDGSVLINNMNDCYNINIIGTVLRKANIYSLSINKGNKNIIFRCSAKILPLELGVIAKKLNICAKLNIDHSSISRNNFMCEEVKKKVTEYCERDVKICHTFMIKVYQTLYNFNHIWWGRVYTVSGIAFSIFRDMFNKYEIDLRLDKEIDEIIREAYYGGRCEVFGNPKENENIFHFDFSSMYTNMLKEEFPVGKCVKRDKINKINKPGFYNVCVESNLKIPILPYRCTKTGKLIFPNGSFSGLYWYEELLLFIEFGGIVKNINWALTFDNMEYAFKEFGETCIENRKKDLISNIMWKLIPNSFIGRLGLKNENERTIIIKDEAYNPNDERVIADRFIGGMWLVRIRENSKSKGWGNVIYPAIITSKARILWYKTAMEVIKKEGRILYCDTDSIFVSFKRNIIGEVHGVIKWEDNNENTVVEKACFAASKLYAIKYKNKTEIKIKGIKRGSIVSSFEDFEELFYNNKKKNFKMSMFKKNFFNMTIEEADKLINFGGYDKRVFKNKKKETESLKINEDTLYNDDTL